MEAINKETKKLVEVVNIMQEIIVELLPDFDETPDLFGIDFDFV